MNIAVSQTQFLTLLVKNLRNESANFTDNAEEYMKDRGGEKEEVATKQQERGKHLSVIKSVITLL